MHMEHSTLFSSGTKGISTVEGLGTDRMDSHMI